MLADHVGQQSGLSAVARRAKADSLAIVFCLLLALVKALNNRRSPRYQRGLIREPPGKIGMVLLHDVERRFARKPAMKLGK
jgi:hypothetical protein